MEGVGWEIRPAGWILIIIVAALLTYYILERLSDFPGEKQADVN